MFDFLSSGVLDYVTCHENLSTTSCCHEQQNKRCSDRERMEIGIG